ncbi:MAG: tRNA epoxyqueuosine(34) reductase QueG [Tissierellia bacterium]|nr:tRNA epoxyqueuosine(34) reductase QueG [Tissierellia bacterium]
MKQIIKEAAYKLGIETVGISNITDYSYLDKLLINRKNNNQDCEFEEQDINKRLNAKNLFPETKSIIAIGYPYGEGYRLPLVSKKGLLSVSCHGEDYHKKVYSLLVKLAEEIMHHIEFRFLPCVDTTFLIDKEICRSAGIGSYGKNSLLINKNNGSFINLGYLLTDIETEGDTAIEKDICGTCNLCVKSCPNNAIFETGGINCKRCVSYLTQTKNYIPLEYRENMGKQIYGCDICQIVCPLNKDVLNKEINADYSDLIVDIKELLNISNKGFINKYGHTAGGWRGRNVWKRNSLISIGNLKIKSMFQNIKDELQNPSEMIKLYAAWSLLKLNRPSAEELLYNNLKYEENNVKNEYLKLLEVEL